MAAKTYTQETQEAFYNVRVGGPKEKRLRKVELMGEHQPKPIFYIKVVQDPDDQFLACSTLQAEFSRIGVVGDVYRPLSSETQRLLNFAFVGFYNEAHVDIAVKIFASKNVVDGKKVTVAAVQTWMLDLYPNRAPGHMHEGINYPSSLRI
mmetsp:Transcript_30334/g.41755  ORF Transcript_30334/g.41755 Transcript_30334/m.41755 type:complete len:150 (+) Transcript_30334:54-503(+)